MKYLDMTPREFALIRAQAARSWAINIVRTLKPGATWAEVRRYTIQAQTWAGILRKLGAELPNVDRPSFVAQPQGSTVEVYSHSAADAERRRLVRIICGRETKSSPAGAHIVDAARIRIAK